MIFAQRRTNRGTALGLHRNLQRLLSHENFSSNCSLIRSKDLGSVSNILMFHLPIFLKPYLSGLDPTLSFPFIKGEHIMELGIVRLCRIEVIAGML